MSYHVLSSKRNRRGIFAAAGVGALVTGIWIVSSLGGPSLQDLGIQPETPYNVVVSSDGDAPADQSDTVIVIKELKRSGGNTFIQMEAVPVNGNSYSFEVKETPDTTTRIENGTSAAFFNCADPAAAEQAVQDALNTGACTLRLVLIPRDLAALE